MRRSPMKRGKEAGVGEKQCSLTIEQLLTELRLGGDVPMSQLRDMAASCIQALQQRCEELEAYGADLECQVNDLEEQYQHAEEANLTFGKQAERTAALEGALKAAHCPHRAPAISVGECINVGWCGGHQECEMRQALSAREEPGEIKPHSYVPSAQHMGDCRICGHVEDSPIHGTGRQSEGSNA